MHGIFSFDILAYFDPGSGSLLMQALVGGAAGLLVFAKFVWDAMLKMTQARKSREPNTAAKELATVGSQPSIDGDPHGWRGRPTDEKGHPGTQTDWQ